jgi:uncharacterized protein (DUF3084 family)
MTDVIALIASLVVISGVIAYVGDVLGTYIGKKRLSLFGTRPKRTGQIIGIGAGIAVALVTLGVSALVFRGAVTTIFNAQSTYQQLAELKAQEKNLQDQVQALDSQMNTTKDELDKANQTISTAQTQQQEAEAERDKALREVTALAEQRQVLETNAATLKTNLTALQTELASATSDLEKAQTGLADVQDQLSTANEERQTAVAEAEQAKTAADAATQQATELQTQIETVQTDLESKSAELLTQTQALAEAKANLGAAQASVEQAQSDLETAQQERGLAVQERDAAQTQITSLQATRDNLKEALKGLNRDILRLQTTSDELTVQNANLNTQNQKLLEESATLGEANAVLKTDNETLTSEIAAQNTQAERLKDNITVLTQQLEDQAKELTRVNEQISATNSGELTYNTNAVIHNGVITSQDPVQIRTDIAQLINVASDKTAQRGAGRVELRTEQLDSLVQAISESPDADIVTLRSPYNQFGTAPVSVHVEASENQKLLGRGQLVVSRQIHLGSDLPITSDEVSTKVRELLRDANNKLLSLGLADDVYDVSTADGSSLSPEAFSNELLRLTGPVMIGLVASEEVYSSGPVKLSLIIIN